MSYNGSGTFNLFSPGNPVVTGTTISSSWANSTLSDIATGLSTVICSDGQTTPTANIPMGGFKLTGLGAGTAAGNSLRYEQVFNNQGTVASASTTNLDTSGAWYQQITGTTTITAITLANGEQKTVEFAGILTLTNGASLILPGGVNIVTAAGDTAIFAGESGGIVRCIGYFPAGSNAWTPVLTFATPGDLSVSYTTQLGKYTKIGNMVFVDFVIVTSAFTFTTASGNLTLTGLPFTGGGSGMFYCGSLQFSGITKASYTQVVAYVSSTNASVSFRASGSAQALSQVTASDTPSGGSIVLNGSIAYKVS